MWIESMEQREKIGGIPQSLGGSRKE